MSPQEHLKLAALQIEPSSHLSEIFLQISKLIKQAKTEQNSFDCVVLPEYTFGTLREWPVIKSGSDSRIEQIHNAVGEIAKQNKVAIVAGSVPYQTKKKQWRNRSFILSASGDILGAYDKQHPFRAEKLLGLEPGTQTPIFYLGSLRVGVLICSDLWYHQLVAEVASKVDFLAVPTMTTVLDSEHIHYGHWAWQSLVGVRAKEYTIPIISADQAFQEYAPGVFTCGGSCIADPSHRFTNNDQPESQALRTTLDRNASFVTSSISLNAIREYTRYRRNVGLRQ